MKLDTLRMIVGFTIILSHCFTFYLILMGTDGLTVEERAELSLLVSPVFAVYVTSIVRHFVKADAGYDTSATHPALRILSIGAAVAFGVAVPLTVIKFVDGKIANFQALKTALGVMETALGVYTGAVVDRLFGSTGGRERKAGSRKVG